MLGSFLFDSRFGIFCQSGWLVDFFLKKCSEVFVRNVFIYTSLFFSEKYIIEGLTKRIIDIYLSATNQWFNFISFTHVNFFLNFVSFLFYSLTILNLFLIFY